MNHEQYSMLMHSVKEWNLWRTISREQVDLRGADLYGTDLHGTDLRVADLGRANLREADLSEACLHGANLHCANLREASLWGSDLGGADLLRADLSKADLREANLRGANFRRADLGGANLHGADLRGAFNIVRLPCFDPRNYQAYAVSYQDGLHIIAGCLNLPLPKAREYWSNVSIDYRDIAYQYLWLCDLAEHIRVDDDGILHLPKLSFERS